MPSGAGRTSRVEARITSDSLALVRRAAEIQGRSVSDFIVTAAQDAAERTIEQTQMIRLSVRDQRNFVAVLLDPPPVSPALARAIERHRTLVSQTR